MLEARRNDGQVSSPNHHSPLEGESQKPSRQAKADAVGGVHLRAVPANNAPATRMHGPCIDRARRFGNLLSPGRKRVMADVLSLPGASASDCPLTRLPPTGSASDFVPASPTPPQGGSGIGRSPVGGGGSCCFLLQGKMTAGVQVIRWTLCLVIPAPCCIHAGTGSVGNPVMLSCFFNHSPLEGESRKPSPWAKADAVGGVHPRAVPANNAPATRMHGPCIDRARRFGNLLSPGRKRVIADVLSLSGASASDFFLTCPPPTGSPADSVLASPTPPQGGSGIPKGPRRQTGILLFSSLSRE